MASRWSGPCDLGDGEPLLTLSTPHRHRRWKGREADKCLCPKGILWYQRQGWQIAGVASIIASDGDAAA